jgi:hypothetical protein
VVHIDPQIGVIGFLVAFVLGRVLARQAVAHLDATQKVQLVDGMGWHRVAAPLILLVLVGAYYLALKSSPESGARLQAGFIGAALLLVIAAIFVTQRRIRSLGLPQAYLRLITVSQAVQLVGALLLLGSFTTG